MGVPLALLAGYLARHELIQSTQHDPWVLLAAACVLPVLALAGTLLPARRAASIDPIAALRAE